jgi:hypothetical protein
MSRTPGWDREFTDPIALPDGRILRTLREAAAYVQKLPKAEQALPHWQIAVEHLIHAAERKPAWMLLAWMAMMRALNHGEPRQPRTPGAKAVKTYRIVR